MAMVDDRVATNRPTPPEELKRLAREVFPPDVAEGVARDIENQAANESVARGPSPETGAGATYERYIPWVAAALYDGTKTGKLHGLPIVQWNGMDRFTYLVDASRPFWFETADGRRIEPQAMPTDGGTIPYLFRALKAFSPWGYAPAFIVHDWLFEAHHGGHAPDHDWTLDGANGVLTSIIKTLMANGYVGSDGRPQQIAKDDDALYLIDAAVKFGSAQYWNRTRPVVA